jgi:D-lyxose ketol-isomerase
MNYTKESLLPLYLDLIQKANFPLTDEELKSLVVNDFGLDNLEEEGFGLIDLLRSERVRVNLVVLLPNQSLPEHLHPAYENEKGKEETIRVLYGTTRVFIEGEPDTEINIPKGKEQWYTALKRIYLKVGEQFTVPAQVKHWFQAGENGSVNIAFQNRVNESHNVFYDPASDGCKISNENKY